MNFAPIDGINSMLTDIRTYNSVTLAGQKCRCRQSNIAKTDNID